MRGPPYLRFNADQANLAYDDWKCNCGPSSIAAATGRTLGEVRKLIPSFRGWMNPTHMTEALGACGQRFALTKKLKTKQLCRGINRVQFEGKFLAPGVDPRAAYHHTHWVAHFEGRIFCTASGLIGWLTPAEWQALLLVDTKYTGWHVTHHYVFPLDS